MLAPSAALDTDSLRDTHFRLVIVDRERRRSFGARLVTVNARMLLFNLSSVLPEREAPGGSLVELAFADDDGLHSFTTRAMAMSPRGGLWVQRPELVHTLQRRAHFRVRTRVRGQAIVARADHSVLSFPFETADLSGGGTRFGLDCSLDRDDDIILDLDVPGESVIAAHARLVRCSTSPEGGFSVGVAFERLPASGEARIVRFLNHEQIRQRVGSMSSWPPRPSRSSRPGADR